jgi:hypothetical protein
MVWMIWWLERSCPLWILLPEMDEGRQPIVLL